MDEEWKSTYTFGLSHAIDEGSWKSSPVSQYKNFKIKWIFCGGPTITPPLSRGYLVYRSLRHGSHRPWPPSRSKTWYIAIITVNKLECLLYLVGCSTSKELMRQLSLVFSIGHLMVSAVKITKSWREEEITDQIVCISLIWTIAEPTHDFNMCVMRKKEERDYVPIAI